MTDDWFAEPKARESLHDLYTRRLTAWGYLDKRGRCAWEPRTGSFFELLQSEYSSVVLDMFNSPLVFGRTWKDNPEGPA